MPKILARDPAWLARSTPASELFKADHGSRTRAVTKSEHDGASRKIAHRGAEVFVAVGNELRWSDLGVLKDAGEDRERQNGQGEKKRDWERLYRVLKMPASLPISQLSVSPSGNYLAVLTSHTCHVCILPQPDRPRGFDASAQPLRLKSFQVGPTAHVLDQAPLVCALWHPLAPTGDCLVTMTRDACVRLWELDSENRASFDQPSLAIDLKKLANATSNQADLSASKFGTNKGFSPDQVEMEVAAACFGGQGTDEEHGWASMTLWVAMSEGDVYALCPFLPSKWAAPATLLPSLSTGVMERSKSVQKDAEATELEGRTVEQQCKWLAEVDAQEPHLMPGHEEYETVEVYSRPLSLSSVPKLQGPFHIMPEPDFGEITDIHVVAPKMDSDALFGDDDLEDATPEVGLSVSIICLATTTNEVHLCLDLDGVEAEWLPNKRSRAFTFDDVDDEKELLLIETVDLATSDAEDDGWPTFTISPADRYELFVTHPGGVSTLNFQIWAGLLEDELSTPSDSGVKTRMDIALDSASTTIDSPVLISSGSSASEGGKLNTSLAILEQGIGYIVLTSTSSNTPYATELDIPTTASHAFEPDLYAPNSAAGLLPAPEPRAPYRPDAAFDQPSQLPQLLKSAQDRNLLAASDLKNQVRFSPATLQLMTEAHRVLASETHKLGIAAADLFRRCERMRIELQEQIRKVGEIAGKVDSIAGANDEEGLDGEEGDPVVGKEKIELRVERSSARGKEVAGRVDALRRRMTALGGRAMSAKEKAFQAEIERLESSLRSAQADNKEVESFTSSQSMSSPPSTAGQLATRFESLLSLSNELQARTRSISGIEGGKGDVEEKRSQNRTSSMGVGGEFRRQRLQQVFAMLERETALVEGVGARLRRLERGV